MRMRSSIARWFDEPLPAEAIDSCPGFDLASAMYSWNEETGVFGAAVSTIGTDWIAADGDEILDRIVGRGS